MHKEGHRERDRLPSDQGPNAGRKGGREEEKEKLIPGSLQ